MAMVAPAARSVRRRLEAPNRHLCQHTDGSEIHGAIHHDWASLHSQTVSTQPDSAQHSHTIHMTCSRSLCSVGNQIWACTMRCSVALRIRPQGSAVASVHVAGVGRLEGVVGVTRQRSCSRTRMGPHGSHCSGWRPQSTSQWRQPAHGRSSRSRQRAGQGSTAPRTACNYGPSLRKNSNRFAICF